MANTRRTVRPLVIGGALGLLVIVASAGALLAWTEGSDYVTGVRLAFSTVSTTGFGMGPQTTIGTLVVFASFAAGVCCWFALVVACFQLGLRRYHESVPMSGLRSLSGEPWPPSVVPKGRG